MDLRGESRCGGRGNFFANHGFLCLSDTLTEFILRNALLSKCAED